MTKDVGSVAYNGQLFRSKLAAYWAVFFDSLRIKYSYQAGNISLDSISYTPDFWLPHSIPGLAAEGWGFWETRPKRGLSRHSF